MYYEDQKEESLRRSKDYIANRLPKFLGYFERVLKSKASGDGPWLYGGKLTYADLVLFQVYLSVQREDNLVVAMLTLYSASTE